MTEGLSANAKVILGCVITLTIVLSIAMFFMYHYLNELTSSPLIIGAQRTVQANNAQGLMCSCQLEGIDTSTKDPTFYFNTTTIWNKPRKASEPIEFYANESDLQRLFNTSN